jgi:hypothetical protein
LQSGDDGAGFAAEDVPELVGGAVTVFEAVEAELAELKAAGALAATALKMAEELDNPKNGATSKSMCATVLAKVMGEIRALAPPVEVEDELSRIRRERADRRKGQAAPADSARP